MQGFVYDKRGARAQHPGSHILEPPYLAESAADEFLGQIVVYAIAVLSVNSLQRILVCLLGV